MKILPVGAELFPANGETDGRTFRLQESQCEKTDKNIGLCLQQSIDFFLQSNYSIVVVVLMMGPISTAAMKDYCTLHPNIVPSFISRGAPHQSA
jgi:hypothetical protein